MWSSTYKPAIDPEIICHRLSIKADTKPVKQKPRRISEERCHAISDKVNRLLQAGFILSNSVLMKKKNGKWRVCIDFTNLNKVCLKDNYPLLRINQLVEATAGHELFIFMEAYSGYNQIKMMTKSPSLLIGESITTR